MKVKVPKKIIIWNWVTIILLALYPLLAVALGLVQGVKGSYIAITALVMYVILALVFYPVIWLAKNSFRYN